MYVQNNAQAVVELKNDIYYDGYFQKNSFVKDVLDDLRSQILIVESYRANYQNVINDIEKLEITSIHIRRGDYINVEANRKIFEICDMNY